MRAELIRRIFVIFLEKHQKKNHHSNVKSKMLIPRLLERIVCSAGVTPKCFPLKEISLLWFPKPSIHLGGLFSLKSCFLTLGLESWVLCGISYPRGSPKHTVCLSGSFLGTADWKMPPRDQKWPLHKSDFLLKQQEKGRQGCSRRITCVPP